jgi:hypothetical protein
MSGFRHWQWHLDEMCMKKALKRAAKIATSLTSGLAVACESLFTGN